jgi:hypothetical protein
MYCEYCGGLLEDPDYLLDTLVCDTCPAVYYGGECINKEEVEKEQLEEIEALKKFKNGSQSA